MPYNNLIKLFLIILFHLAVMLFVLRLLGNLFCFISIYFILFCYGAEVFLNYY